ncbi:Fungal specific transcription factor domain-containing protein [Cladophialophora immunda]|nr:Fungal specific transcription factor domain-containing protein [Cladophialophora immunda]
MQSVKRMIQQKVSGATQPERQSLTPNPQLQHLPASGNASTTQKQFDYVLPSRRRADILMSVYWKYVHVLYPYLDKPRVQEDYEKLWKGDAGPIDDERSYLCLLNTMFALASQLDESTSIEEREQLAHTYYTRARGLLDIVDGGSVRSVQSFLLLAQYFQSTNEPHPCWMFVGLGIRTAQSLGLHLPETSERAPDIRTRELLRKVWHGCILMDRVICMTYGRPCMIGPKAAVTVPLPLAIEEEDLMRSPPQEQAAGSQRSSAVEFYVHSLKLYTILHDVLFNFYSVNFKQTRPLDADKYFGSLSEGQSSVFEIEHRLFGWENSIPDHLKMDPRPQVEVRGAQLYRQAVILHQRQLHVRLLLLRPVLSSFITTEFYNGDRSVPLASALSHRVFLQCAIVCVRVALEAIHIIYRERGRNAGDSGSLAAWWYNVLYLYTSATVLIAARLCPAIFADVSEESILDGWRKAMEILDWYSPFGTSIKRLTTTLRLLSDAVPQQYSRFKGNSQQSQPNTSSAAQNLGQRSPSMSSWRPPEPVDNIEVPVADTAGAAPQDDLYLFSNEPFLDFDSVFDPNDLSWLMTIPLDS